MRILFNGRRGRTGSVIAPALEAGGHELVEDLAAADAVVDFTRPEAVVDNVGRALDAGVPAVVGTTSWDEHRLRLDERAKRQGVPVFHAPNFALGAVLMMRFAAEAGRYLDRAEIVELHHEAKVDVPSGTARATAELLGRETAIHSVRLPGLVAHQEVLFGAPGQLLTIRHDTLSREAFAPGVLLALDRLSTLPPGLTIGMEALLE